jgi:hypothetical protein
LTWRSCESETHLTISPLIHLHPHTQAYAINEYTGLKFSCAGAAPGACKTTGEQVLLLLSFDEHTTSYPLFGMGMVLLGFLGVAYFIIDNSRAKYTPVGWKGGKFDGLAATAAKSDSGYMRVGAGGDVPVQSVAITDDDEAPVGLELTNEST